MTMFVNDDLFSHHFYHTVGELVFKENLNDFNTAMGLELATTYYVNEHPAI